MLKRRFGALVLLATSMVLVLAACTTPVTKPAAFTFVDVVGAEPGASVTSNEIVISGITAPATVKVTGDGVLVIDGKDVTKPGSVVNNAKLRVKLTASTVFGATVSTTVNVGGQEATFSVTTRPAATQPDAIVFTTAEDVEPGATVLSNVVTIGGVDSPLGVAVSGDGDPALLINGAPAPADPTVQTGDTVLVSLTASADFGASVTATVTMDDQAATFTAITRAFEPAVIALTTDPANPSPAAPGSMVTVSWTVTGDYDTLTLSNDRTAGTQDVTGLAATQVVIPSEYPSITYTLEASHAQQPGAPVSASTSSIAVPLWVCQDDADLISFADSGLEAAFRTAAGLPASGPITCADALGVTVLNTDHHVDGPGHISSLVGMQHLRNLQNFRAPYNDIVSLAPLAGLTSLHQIHLDKNMVTDLTPLAGLTDLEYISFWDSGPIRQTDDTADDDATCRDGIADLTPLTALVNLKEIYLSCNDVTSLQPLANMPDLEVLYLISNRVSNLSPLSGKTQLQALRLSDNHLTSDSGVFATLTGLRWLQVAYNGMSDASLTGLGSLANLYSLDAEGNYFSSFTPLIGNPNFPGTQRFGRDDMEPSDPTVSLGFNCIEDVAEVATTLEAKGVVIVGKDGPQRTDCDEGFGGFGAAPDSDGPMLQQFRLRQAQSR